MEWETNGLCFDFEISEYNPGRRCTTSLRIDSKYFNYYIEGYILEYYEIDTILVDINRLLNRTMYTKENLKFIEPYFYFNFYPPTLEREIEKIAYMREEHVDKLTDLYAELVIQLDLNNAPMSSYFTLRLPEEVLVELRDYLLEVTGHELEDLPR